MTIGNEMLENGRILEQWQDWIIGNLQSASYLNRLMVLASRDDFAFSTPNGYLVQYVQNNTSFRQTVAQLATQVRITLSGAREDINRAHVGMERVPTLLKTAALLLKQAPYDLLSVLFPDSFNDIERLVNDSLIVLRKPAKSFQQVEDFFTEINYLLNNSSPGLMVSYQVYDTKAAWTNLTKLAIELAERAERIREKLLLQFNWILKEFIRPDLPSAESHRQFILFLIIPKIVEIDQLSDILGIITKTYSDISFQYTDEQIGGNAHLLLLSDETVRKRYLKQYLRDLIPQAVYTARLALERHTNFLLRDENRRENYERVLLARSQTD